MSILPDAASPSVIAKARSIKLLALDVDGVLSDGRLYFSAQGDELKTFSTLDEVLGPLGLSLSQAAYMGDDLPDLPAIRAAGLGLTVPNGYWLVRQHADWCSRNPGGMGAVREACDLILDAQDLLAQVLDEYLPAL